MFAKVRSVPPRFWALEGVPGVGKSVFSTRMHGPLLVVDADQRYCQMAQLVAAGQLFSLSENPQDHTDPVKIGQILMAEMPGAKVGTIIIDSMTTLYSPLVALAMLQKDRGEIKNLAAALRPKAQAMQILADIPIRWGADVLWIYHLKEARNAKAEEVLRPSISALELERLRRVMNARISLGMADGRRSARIEWCRAIPERSGIVVEDSFGMWLHVPELIDAAMAAPVRFSSPEAAFEYGVKAGAFQTDAQAGEAYAALKGRASNAIMMAGLWNVEVQRRKFEAGDASQD